MSKIDELQNRVEHLETEIDLLKVIVKVQNKCPKRIVPTSPITPLQPYHAKGPIPEPPYKITCGCEDGN